jgi:hypothetical protein
MKTGKFFFHEDGSKILQEIFLYSQRISSGIPEEIRETVKISSGTQLCPLHDHVH